MQKQIGIEMINKHTKGQIVSEIVFLHPIFQPLECHF